MEEMARTRQMSLIPAMKGECQSPLPEESNKVDKIIEPVEHRDDDGESSDASNNVSAKVDDEPPGCTVGEQQDHVSMCVSLSQVLIS